MLVLAGCGNGTTATGPAGADLSGFRTARIHVNGVAFEVWLAETTSQQFQGLMEATPEQLAPLPDGTPRGMLFVFPSDIFVNFTMDNTYVALDLAHFRSDGLLVETHDLVPLDTTLVRANEAVRYSLEVPAGTLAVHGISVGANLALPIP